MSHVSKIDTQIQDLIYLKKALKTLDIAYIEAENNCLLTVEGYGKQEAIENCVMEIEDNGIGIPEEDKNLIWGRFYQVNDSRNKKVNKGFGLGLSLVAKIIEQHNASIDVESKLNQGTKFVAKFMKSE